MESSLLLSHTHRRSMEPTSPLSNPKSSLEDVFDSSINLEQIHLEEGFRDGFNDGLIAGKEEGKDVGLKLGFEIGEEFGFYRGIVDVFVSAIRLDSDGKFSSRIIKIVEQMDELFRKYPILEPENESGTEIMESLRLKFRVLSTRLLPKRLEYEGYSKSSSGASEIEF
eukprot:TRINITY_DN7557_c0_g1_i1.p1 TRINITY_DN7557_c0_g1~~TRINITY_DN7557_c0_g1_i1.p1  ORF type:complete len:192 (+),score=20.25 TRINITY_DN7557_c0_g1_i1:74-577(+)